MFFVFFTDYKKSLISAFVNTAFILYIAYQPSLQWIAHTLPILSFFIIITAVAWIYQRTLDNSMISLQAARQQLMQDTLIRQELAIARNLQQELYPKPQHYSECLDIGASVQPALETSGDLYDLIRLNDDEIAIIVGDATGKSVAAAMVMAMTRSIIRSEARRSRNPGHVLRHVNAILHADDAVNQMMTVWYGVLNLRHHQLRFANAGHPFPLLRRNGVVQELEAFGTPLRSIRNFPYAEQTIQLQANDRLVVYTDGVIETMNEDRELYSFDRWCAAVRDIEAENTAGLIDAYCAAVDEFRGAARQADDLTLVVVDIIKDPSEVVTLPVADTTAVVVTADQ
ncbi:protein serine/threonine phosphatase [Herpetosiphon aurantiacus DSM 785]|uniref:Protein serine/threonine phosphatase n=2 Tax=Herpetosiphon TaxID=64 RepID=A9AXK6_HERA2|nr:protein serine/threonine phosphatase [Herpetosiphon aurantiacus DSM 785]